MRARQQGYILLPVVLLITLVATVAFMLNNESALNSRIGHTKIESGEIEYVAQAGMNHALWQVGQAGCGPYTDISGEAFGAHSYSATVATNNVGGTISTIIVPVIEDAYIQQDNSTTNFGSVAELQLGGSLFGGNYKRPIYRFDIASAGIAPGATLISAVAKFHVISFDHTSAVSVHQVTATWDEASVNWDNISSSLNFMSIGSIPSGTPTGEFVDVNMTALVQSWINGAEPNYGVTLAPAIFNSTQVSSYTSKEYGNTSQRPYLEIKVADGSLANRADISATGTLASGVVRTITQSGVPLYQPGGNTTLQPDAAGGEDAEIWKQSPNNNYGNANETWVSSASNDTTRTLLRFNMGEIPVGARIQEATLSLFRQSGSGANQPVSAHRIMNPWSEGSVTWNERESGTNWDTAGVDFDDIAVTTTPVGPANQRYEWNITPLAQGWVNSSYPNNGVVLVAAIAGLSGERFNTSDHTNSSKWPSLSITYACECGIVCMAPQGSGNVLLVVGDDVTLNLEDSKKKTIIEDWGYTVNLIDDADNQSAFDAALGSNDVAYISDTADDATLADKLANTSKAVLNEDAGQNANLGLSGGGSYAVSQSMEIVDNSHYITAIFPAGVLPINRAPMEGLVASGTQATGLQALGNFAASSSLALVDTGGLLGGDQSGVNVPGRRVMLPIGSVSKFNWDYLNNNGRLMVQRAIQWGTGNATSAPIGNLLLVVSDAANPASKDTGRKVLMESWGYVVTLIDDNDSQANFDVETAATDVVYVSGTISGGSLLDKLTGSPASIINEFPGKLDNFGFSSVTTGTTNADTFTLTNAGHYITEPFTGNPVTVFTGSLSMPVPGGSIVAPDLQNVGEVSGTQALVTLEAGATRWDGNPTPARRAFLPFSSAETNQLTIDGNNIMKRALEWGMGAGTAASTAPLAHWKLDETSGLTAVDSVGGHDGTHNDVADWSGGQIDGALNFDGSNDAIHVPHADTLSLTDAMTFIAWVNASSYGASYQTIVAKDSGVGNSNYYFGTWQQELVFGFFAGPFFREVFTTGLNLQPGTWYQLAASFDNATDEVRLYVDGVEVLNDTLAFSPTAVTADLLIGKSPIGEYWRGLLDDVRIYDSVLPASEIAGLYTGGGGGGSPPPPPGIVFEEFTEAKSGNNGKSFVITKPAGTAEGDLLIAVVATDGKQEDGIDPPAGWHLINFGIRSEEVSMGVWWKIAGSSEPASYDVTWPEKQEAYGFIIRFTGHDVVNPINIASNTGGTSKNSPSPAVTTTVDNAMILRIGGFDDDDISIGNPGLSGHSVITMDKSSNGKGTVSAGAGYLIQPSVGSSGASSFSLTKSEQYRTVTIGIAPAP